MKRIIYTIAAFAAVLTGSAVAAAPAMASNGPAQFVTHAGNHPDTTSLPAGVTGATIPTDGGPVWAFDDLTVKLTPVAGTYDDGADYRVFVTVNGSFHGFADPQNGNALDSTGPVTGSIYYDVQSNGAVPDGAKLPAQEPGGIGAPGLRKMVTQLFGGGATIAGGGDIYTFNYQNGNYTQVATPTLTITGDVRGH
jgi:hypothetical protein